MESDGGFWKCIDGWLGANLSMGKYHRRF